MVVSDEMFNFGLSVLISVCFSIALGTRDSPDTIILPLPLGPGSSICTSYSGLCHMMYNLTDTDTYQVVNSAQQICRCPAENPPCETDWLNNDRSITKVFKSAGQEIQVKMSYCALTQPDKVCRRNEVALVTRGSGAFTFELDPNSTDFRCRCYREMYAHRSWRVGAYDYIAYSCGKPRCGMNRSASMECMSIVYDGSPTNFIHDYSCRCRRHEECTVSGELPTPMNRVVTRTCQLMSSSEIERRREMRRHYQQVQ